MHVFWNKKVGYEACGEMMMVAHVNDHATVSEEEEVHTVYMQKIFG